MIEILPLQKKIKAKIALPGSKSLSNRAVLLSSIANKTSTIKNFLNSDDTKVMIKALKTLGVKITEKDHTLDIKGTSANFKKANHKLNLGNAGTAVRFLTAVLCAASFHGKIDGDQRMRQRPIQDLLDALNQLGSNVKSVHSNGCPPLAVQSNGSNGGKVYIKGKNSSQYLSALLIAAPLAKKNTEIIVKDKLTSLPYIQMTLDLMSEFGIEVKNQNFKKFTIKPGIYKSKNITIEGDASSSVYFWAIAAATQSTITTTNIPSGSKQADLLFLDVLLKMGCKVKKSKSNITVTGPKVLKPLGTINLNSLPDGAMCVAILCTLAEGKSKLTGLHNLVIKETDRLAALKNELVKTGCNVGIGKDYIEIAGNAQKLHGAKIETYNDHRMAMCFSVLGTKVAGINITNPECTSKTYPNFFEDLKKIGIELKKQNANKTHSNLPKNIVIGGMRGAGKTTIGKLLAKELNYNFIDTDAEVEKQQKNSIPEIIKQKGWNYFRQLEKELVKYLKNIKHTVISTGGGVLINRLNANKLKQLGPIIIIDCKPETCLNRIELSFKRPTLSKNKKYTEEIYELHKKRSPIYKKVATIIIDNDQKSPKEAVKEIIQSLRTAQTI